MLDYITKVLRKDIFVKPQNNYTCIRIILQINLKEKKKFISTQDKSYAIFKANIPL